MPMGFLPRTSSTYKLRYKHKINTYGTVRLGTEIWLLDKFLYFWDPTTEELGKLNQTPQLKLL